ncbi:MAG: hypothetical protein L3K03_08530 [Thermoplasmata archaeon]|nr:hypothetical protein [Thermoplasmata archaeon]
MKIQFQGTPDSDEIADAFILAFLATRKGHPANAREVWRSLRSRGFVPTDGTPTPDANPDEGAAIAEISRRMQKWLEQGVIGGEAEPEALTEERHFWVIAT